MNFSSRLFDLAEQRVEEEREAAIAAASRSLQASGTRICAGCKTEISPERRAALPSAKRCIGCQTELENNVRGR